MEYLYFPEQTLSEYDLNAGLLTHSRISENHRARLFSWLSEECYKQRLSRYSFVLACSYIDLYFMKKNDVQLKNYQLLALGALILATKQAETEGRIPIIDLNLFKPVQLLGMQEKLVFALNFFLNPPIYIELLNNIAKMWDNECESGDIRSSVRYFNENRSSYLRLKTLYEKMDCLNMFKRILDFNINEVVLTLFYLHTKLLDSHASQTPTESFPSITAPVQNPEDQSQFDISFKDFLLKSKINTKTNPKVEKIIKMFSKDKLPINDSTIQGGKTFTEILSFQSYNKHIHQFYRSHQAQITRI